MNFIKNKPLINGYIIGKNIIIPYSYQIKPKYKKNYYKISNINNTIIKYNYNKSNNINNINNYLEYYVLIYFYYVWFLY